MQTRATAKVEPAARTPRTNLFIAATLEWRGEQALVRLRNLSPEGALIEGAVLPAPGTAVRLSRGALAATGTIMWTDGGRGGVRLNEQLDVAAWMARTAASPPPGALPATHAVRPVREGFAVQPGNAPTAILLPPAEELRAIARLVEELAADLATDPDPRQSPRLAALDRVAQRLAGLRGRLG